MPVHPFDFDINPHVYSTPELTALFDEQAVYQRWLDFEAALARAQARHGVIPEEAAREIAAKARLGQIDLAAVAEGYAKSRNSVVPLLGGLRRACASGHGEYVHYGATTQDVLDTGEVLALKATLAILYRDLHRLEGICLDLAERHRATWMVARTHGQQALPSTFGLKVAGWTTELRRHLDRLQHLRPLINFGQLSGAVGTYAALGEQGEEIAREAMALLGLEHAPLSWHTSRDHIAELASAFAMLVMTLAKIANEIIQLQKTEIAELVEPSLSGAQASSTMPHKRNPVICQRVTALSRHVRALAATVMDSMAHEHERDPRSLWSEWLAIPQLCIYTGYCLHMMIEVLSGLEVRGEQMLANLSSSRDLITSEWLLFRLSADLGKTRALAKVKALAALAADQGLTLREAVLADPEIGPLFGAADLAPLDRPELYVGRAVALVDQCVAEIRRRRAAGPQPDAARTEGP